MLTTTEEVQMSNIDINTVLTAAAGMIGALGGFEFIKWLFNRKSNERIAAAQAFEAEYKSLTIGYKRQEEEIQQNKKEIAELNQKVDALYEKVHKLENDKLQLIQENNNLKLQLKEAEKKVCLQPDDRCLKRLNPNDHCRLRKILRGEYQKDHPDAILSDEDMMQQDNNSNNDNEKEE